jgi:FMN phosphatase YigB (HAD superfamily)
MTEQEQKAGYRFIKPVESLPVRTRERASLYAGIIDEFVRAGLKYAMVNQMDRRPLTVYVGLRQALKRKGIRNVTVCNISNQIYLKKLG